jgi:uncharacterized protein (DUF2267 family)
MKGMSMEEIVKLVAERAGISEEAARKAVEIVVSVLKERLPAPLAGQIDAALSGSGGIDVGSLGKGLLGRR